MLELSNMKLISYDVGIKNMAYVVFDLTENKMEIVDWDVLNLMESLLVPPKTGVFELPQKKKVLWKILRKSVERRPSIQKTICVFVISSMITYN